MKLTIVGSGDAFGSGGRLQTCFHVTSNAATFLIDCGATTMTGMARLGFDPNKVSTIYISHLHGDHFGGLVWFMIHAQHVAKRTNPLSIIGPPGVEARVRAASEILFPGALPDAPKFELTFHEYDEGEANTDGPARVSVHEVRHPCGAPPYALRLEIDGRVIGFSGDTEWVDCLVDVARDADLYITECHAHETETRYHLSWATLRAKLPELTAKRIVLTHMGGDMLKNLTSIEAPRVRLGSDGMVIKL